MPEYRYTDMSKKIYILLLLAAGFFTACSTVQNVPIDDAYYSPAVEKGDLPTPSIPMTQNSQTTQTAQSTQTTPQQSVEYLNVQDTTVTIKIKK
jgi:hypothetical protein